MLHSIHACTLTHFIYAMPLGAQLGAVRRSQAEIAFRELSHAMSRVGVVIFSLWRGNFSGMMANRFAESPRFREHGRCW